MPAPAHSRGLASSTAPAETSTPSCFRAAGTASFKPQAWVSLLQLVVFVDRLPGAPLTAAAATSGPGGDSWLEVLVMRVLALLNELARARSPGNAAPCGPPSPALDAIECWEAGLMFLRRTSIQPLAGALLARPPVGLRLQHAMAAALARHAEAVAQPQPPPPDTAAATAAVVSTACFVVGLGLRQHRQLLQSMPTAMGRPAAAGSTERALAAAAAGAARGAVATALPAALALLPVASSAPADALHKLGTFSCFGTLLSGAGGAGLAPVRGLASRRCAQQLCQFAACAGGRTSPAQPSATARFAAGAVLAELERRRAQGRWDLATAQQLLAAYESSLRCLMRLQLQEVQPEAAAEGRPQHAATGLAPLWYGATTATVDALSYCLGWARAAQPQLSPADGERLLESAASLAATACKAAVVSCTDAATPHAAQPHTQGAHHTLLVVLTKCKDLAEQALALTAEPSGRAYRWVGSACKVRLPGVFSAAVLVFYAPASTTPLMGHRLSQAAAQRAPAARRGQRPHPAPVC